MILIQSREKNKAVLSPMIFATSHTDRVGTNQLGTARTFSLPQLNPLFKKGSLHEFVWTPEW